MTLAKPSRGDIWLIDLNPTRGREQAGKRPCLVTSVDLFNQGASGLVVVLPITSKDKGIPWHVEINPPEGGLRQRSFIKCEDVRSISIERFLELWGTVSSTTLIMVEERLRKLLKASGGEEIYRFIGLLKALELKTEIAVSQGETLDASMLESSSRVETCKV